MNWFAIGGSVWRHKKAAIPVLILTLLGMAYVLVIKPPTYHAVANVLLTNPEAPPTAEQIAADPSLAHVKTRNPYGSLGNLVLVADVLIEIATSDQSKHDLIQAGASPGYKVALDIAADSPPAITVTGVGNSPAAAVRSAQIVATAVSKDLYQIQADQKVDPAYMIGSIEYVQPSTATASVSSKLRTLIGVLAIGFISLFVAVSISQALEERKKKRRTGAAADTTEPRAPSTTLEDRQSDVHDLLGHLEDHQAGQAPEEEPEEAKVDGLGAWGTMN